jgi:hypothetical protein
MQGGIIRRSKARELVVAALNDGRITHPRCILRSLLGRMGRGLLDLELSTRSPSELNMQGIPMTPQRWHPSTSPASLSQRLFCFRQALHALDALDLFIRGPTIE